MTLSRRKLLEKGVLLSVTALVGCTTEEVDNVEDDGAGGGGSGGSGGAGGGGGGGGAPPENCEDAFAGGQLMGNAVWSEAITVPFNSKVGGGLGARLFTDLAALTQETLVVPNENFYVRTEFPSATLDVNAPYEIQLNGLVDSPVTVPIGDLDALVEPHGLQVLECSGNFIDANFGLMSMADWGGVPIQKIFDMVSIQSQATGVRVRGFDHASGNTPGASWVFSFDQLLDAGAILATQMNGVPLPPDHGAPVRLLAPNWFGCCNIKWVNEITFVDDTEPSTAHMQEYASRTLQSGTPSLAVDFLPATMDQTAVPVVIEKWLLDGQIVYRLKGVMWGGYEPTDSLVIQFDSGPAEPVTVCPSHTNNKQWYLWEHLWVPSAAGEYLVQCGFGGNIPQRRLESGRYVRHINIDEV